MAHVLEMKEPTLQVIVHSASEHSIPWRRAESLCEGNYGKRCLETSAGPSGTFLSGPVVITVRSSAPEERSLPPVAALGT